jgi:hypothetical protein
MLAGYNAHAAKPTEPAELLSRIAELAGRRSTTPENP